MKTLFSNFVRVWRATLGNWRKLVAGAGYSSALPGRWIRSAGRLERIPFSNIRVVGATLRSVPPPAAKPQALDRQPVRLGAGVLNSLKQDLKTAGGWGRKA